MPKYRILSLDGGGMKDLFTTTLLERIVEAYPTLLTNVNLIAGTSTGGIVALGLAAGRTPAQLSDLYRKNGKTIFKDSFWDDVVDLGKATGADYNNKNLKSILKKEFESLKLGGLNKNVLIPTFDLDAPKTQKRPRMWKAKFFHNFSGRGSDRAELVVDVAMRTSAAPTYFPSYQGYVDGGVVANNPSVAALSQALEPNGANKKLENVVLLSIGTGTEPRYLPKRRDDWGWARWGEPLIELMLGGLTRVADYQCEQILGDCYQRINTYYDRGVNMDDTKASTLKYLEDQARSLKLARTLDWLRRNGW